MDRLFEGGPKQSKGNCPENTPAQRRTGGLGEKEIMVTQYGAMV